MEREKVAEERAVLKEFKLSVAAINAPGTSSSSVPISPTSLTAKRKEPPGIEPISRKKSQKELLTSVVRMKRSVR